MKCCVGDVTRQTSIMVANNIQEMAHVYGRFTVAEPIKGEELILGIGLLAVYVNEGERWNTDPPGAAVRPCCRERASPASAPPIPANVTRAILSRRDVADDCDETDEDSFSSCIVVRLIVAQEIDVN